jgi:hypothetical protein
MDEREAFRAWLMETRDPGAPKSTGFLVAEAVFPSMAATLRSWAGDPARAARISPHDYATMEPQLAGYDLAPPEFAQMLGHASSVQEPPSPGDTTLCLLNLPSDSTLGWSFGDVGVCSFWIRPEDLERRDFSKAWGVIEGH